MGNCYNKVNCSECIVCSKIVSQKDMHIKCKKCKLLFHYECMLINHPYGFIQYLNCPQCKICNILSFQNL